MAIANLLSLLILYIVYSQRYLSIDISIYLLLVNQCSQTYILKDILFQQ